MRPKIPELTAGFDIENKENKEHKERLLIMSRECIICGKKPVAGRTISRRGMPKSRGGVGTKITGITKRVFSPNIQSVNALIEGKKKKVKVCTKCLKAGKITKAIKKTV